MQDRVISPSYGEQSPVRRLNKRLDNFNETARRKRFHQYQRLVGKRIMKLGRRTCGTSGISRGNRRGTAVAPSLIEIVIEQVPVQVVQSI